MQHMYSTTRGTGSVSAWHDPLGCRAAANAQQHVRACGLQGCPLGGACNSAFSGLKDCKYGNQLSDRTLLLVGHQSINTGVVHLVVYFQLFRHSIMLGLSRHS